MSNLKERSDYWKLIIGYLDIGNWLLNTVLHLVKAEDEFYLGIALRIMSSLRYRRIRS
ncbi:MAG: hypothetical protein GY751_04130 [Bacteroidetes bacterium]|nr:hypothetical protein [Bacteroidota bacterium]